MLWKQALLALFLMMFMDALWIGTNYTRYAEVTEAVQNKAMSVKTLPALISYICLFTFIVLILSIEFESLWQKAGYSLLFGLTGYGIYNFTNLALLENYTLTISIMDTLWGGFLVMTCVMIPTILFSNQKM